MTRSRGRFQWGALRTVLAVALTALVFARGSWSAFTAWSIAEPPAGSWPDDQAALYGRYAAARPVVNGHATVGFVGDGDVRQAPPFLIARVALLPTLLVVGADQPLIVVDAHSEEAGRATLEALPGAEVVWTGEDSLLVVRPAGAE